MHTHTLTLEKHKQQKKKLYAVIYQRLKQHSELLLAHSQMNVRNEACCQSLTVSPESGLDGVDDSEGGKKTIVSFFPHSKPLIPEEYG